MAMPVATTPIDTASASCHPGHKTSLPPGAAAATRLLTVPGTIPSTSPKPASDHGRHPERPARRRDVRPHRVDLRRERLGGERPPNEPERVRRGQCRCEGDDDQSDPGALVDENGQGGFLGGEPEKRGNPCHRCRRQCGGDRKAGEASPEPGQHPYVPGPRLVVDSADHQEERRLEQDVSHQHGEGCVQQQRRAQADQRRHEAELAHGAVGEDQLEVGLAEGAPRTDRHRHEPNRCHDGCPHGCCGETRREAEEQEDPGLHHGGGVEVGTRRCWRRHCTGKPEVEGGLRRFRECADEYQDDGHGGERPRGWRSHDLGEDRRPGGLRKQHEPTEHGEATERRSEDGFESGRPRTALLVLEPDEQVGRDGRQLPEHEQAEQVVRNDDADHRAGECNQERHEPAQIGVWREVPRRVHDDGDPDACDGQREDERKRIESQVEGDRERRDPRDLWRRPPSRRSRLLQPRSPARGQTRVVRGRAGLPTAAPVAEVRGAPAQQRGARR